MSAKAISEGSGKNLLYKNLKSDSLVKSPLVNIHYDGYNWEEVAQSNPWLKSQKLVVKPDQLIKRRGKLGLIKVNVDSAEAKGWMEDRMGKDQVIGSATGKLKNFIIEPFLPHSDNEECYVCIYSKREGDYILFYHQGGVDIGDVDAKASKLLIPVGKTPTLDEIKKSLLSQVDAGRQELIGEFIATLYASYVSLFFTYLEVNPLVVREGRIYILDLAAKLDATAEFICKAQWGDIYFPPPFGREATPEEAYIAEMDAKTGASLKLTILNRKGRIWTMVAGGGASVIYSDTICDLGGAKELANYGEYSGAPNETQTYEYAKTLLQLMTEGDPHPKGKVLIIGGSIANFTNVAATFKGVVKALQEFQILLQKHSISIYVRRGGPNYQEGLRVMKECGGSLGVPVHVFGPETHMTAVVGMALGTRPVPPAQPQAQTTANFLLGGSAQNNWNSPSASATNAAMTSASDEGKSKVEKKNKEGSVVMTSDHGDQEGEGEEEEGVAKKYRRIDEHDEASPSISRKASANKLNALGAAGNGNKLSVNGDASSGVSLDSGKDAILFTKHTKTVVWGLQSRAVQSMLDFDFVCERSSPSVVAMTYPMSGDHKQKFYWGQKEILIPVYKNMKDAFDKHKDASVLVSFASLRSAYDSTMEAISFPQVRTIAIIAEGIPENMTRKIIKAADEAGITIIGPATVGGIKPGALKIGNTGGMMDNILSAKLYRSGNVAYVSRSGGMSNELNNIISQNTNGVYEGVAIGGDMYPGSTFLDHIWRYQADPQVKMIVMLGEVGGTEEYKVVDAIKSGKLSKPIVVWCIGTCAGMFTSEVQFGHAGACASGEMETAVAKNKALKEVGANVPASFDELGECIKLAYDVLVEKGVIDVSEEKPPPAVPMDYAWARELGLIRKPASFMTSICDERGNELHYAGMPITRVFDEDLGIGGVLSLLWFQRRLPPYCCKFIEMCLMVTADHGPAVSGAHNSIVCARAGKDLISSLASGLLTIGDRFGGALDGAAKQFSEAFDSGLIPMEMVNSMRKQGKLIMGIGHRVKSINNPDMRVKILKEYVLTNFPSTPLLNYAIEVEKITTSKKPNLILNVDGIIGVAFVDLLRNCGCFTREEATEYVEIGTLNGLFVLGRSMGFIGHYLDQKRLKQGLYRHPWDDITYVMPELSTDA